MTLHKMATALSGTQAIAGDLRATPEFVPDDAGAARPFAGTGEQTAFGGAVRI